MEDLKNKSEELAKLLGIESKYVIKTEEHTFIYSLANKAEAQRQLQWLGYVNQNIDDYLVNVDLELPSNFVKFLETERQAYIKYAIFPTRSTSITFCEDYDTVKLYLANALYNYKSMSNEELLNGVKQQAQQIEWEY